MAGYKETPRQKMIAMMYLVLTALLALNVSREMLHAFLVVNESISETNEKFAQKIEETYAEFQKQYSISQAKVEPFWLKAQEVQRLTDEMVAYIEDHKYKVIALTEGITVEKAKTTPLLEIDKKDNFDRPTNYFIGPEYNGEAYAIRKRIDEYRNNLLSLIEDEKTRENFNAKLGLKTDGDYYNADKEKEPWERHSFYHTILAADVTILNKIIAEIYNAESDIVNYLLSSITAEDFKFDRVGAKVIPVSNRIYVGDEYSAEILVAGYDTKKNPEVFILEGVDSLTPSLFNSARMIPGENGLVRLSLPASREGLQKYAGIIRLTTPWGEVSDYHFHQSYMVSRPTAAISPTKMNVFYRGVDNPVSISASGVANNLLHIDISTGEITRVDTGYIVKGLPDNATGATIKVWAEDNGQRRLMGQQFFRVKPLPDPIAMIRGAENGKITKSKLLTNAFLHCQLPEWVEFQYPFRVVSFTMILPAAGGYIQPEKSESNKFTDRMINVIQNLGKDSRIIFEDIKAQGPEGLRTIQSINITIL
ncbi:MAG: gliding motility protein GldM [Bacteroidales bacterium]|nr:gliding motility protein GldM [Bacteroidales bacterium]